MDYEVVFDGFDWDAGNLTHATSHGVSKEQIEQAVLGGMNVIATYERNGELRFSATAVTPDGTPIDIAFTLRSGRLRPISVHKLKRDKR